jgi:hypothetical protein
MLNHKIIITFNEQEVPRSPFLVMVMSSSNDQVDSQIDEPEYENLMETRLIGHEQDATKVLPVTDLDDHVFFAQVRVSSEMHPHR